MAKETFVLTLPLKVEKWQADILDKRYELLRQIYNMVQQKLLRQYIYFSQQKEYKACEGDFKMKREFFDFAGCTVLNPYYGPWDAAVHVEVKQ